MGPVTDTETWPAGACGRCAEICVSLITVKDDAGVVPNVTAVAPVKPEPVIVIVDDPHTVPTFGDTLETTGAGTV